MTARPSHESRLKELGIILPEVAPPLASYVPVALDGDRAFVSGQLPFANGEVMTGVLGDGCPEDRAIDAARACALMILAQLRRELGTLDRVRAIVKLGGFVAATPGFVRHHVVLNGASDLMFDVFGEAGRHARAAVGVSGLPLGAVVEVDAIVAVHG